MINRTFRQKILNKIFKRVAYYLNNYFLREEVFNKKSLEENWNNLFLENDFFEYNISNGLRINLYRDSILSKLIYEGYEKSEQEFTSLVLKKGDYFVDIGANIGLFSLIAANIVGDTGKVFSFEPTPLIFNRLKKNVNLNRLYNIQCKNIGLSNDSGLLKLNISNNGYDAWNSFALLESEKLQSQIDVLVSTLDKELDGVDLSKVKLVKIDAEGWEKFIIQGAVNLFTNYSPIVIVEFTETNTFAAGYMVQEIYDQMISFGFRWFSFESNKLVPASKKLHYVYENLIAIKDSNVLWTNNEILDNNN